MLVDDDDFPNEEAAISHAKAIARDIVWHSDVTPGSKLLVVNEAGETVAEIPLIKPLH